MCGIAGFYDPKLKVDDAPNLLHGMLEQISHRGPDARGTYFSGPLALGHNRLSIIDLSVDGNQPMHYHDASIVFNGEIYNYLELRSELISKGYTFNTSSDTEVILASYREYGPLCVEKFIGMWAFAIFDKLSGELFCSRDRFGIKPFYYLLEGDRFYFGSEYKALRKSPIFSNEINLSQVSRGLQLGWVCYEDETYYQKLKSLPAACNLIFKDSGISISKYWSISHKKIVERNPDELIAEFRAILEDSVHLHLRSDVEIGVCLSGGIDSSSLTGLMNFENPNYNYKSYSIYYDGPGEVDERPFINEVIQKYPSLEANFYRPKEEEILEFVHDIMYQVDVPASGSSNFSHYYLLKQIKDQQIKVVVDGQGADEYLGGYMHAMYRHNADLLRSISIGPLSKNLFYNSKYQNQNPVELVKTLGKTALSTFMSEMTLYSLEYKHYFPFVSRVDPSIVPFKLESPFSNSLNNFLYQMLTTSSLPTILHYVDRMTMAHSVESRVPLLDHRLVEFAFALNNNMKIRNGVTKYILREAVKDLLPAKIYNRRDKKGFVTPGENKWLRGPMKHFLDIKYENLNFIDKSKVSQVIDEYRKGDNKNAKLVWRIAMLNYWINNFH